MLPLNTSLHTPAAVSLQNHILNSIVRIQFLSFMFFLQYSDLQCPTQVLQAMTDLCLHLCYHFELSPLHAAGSLFDRLHQTVKSQPYRSDLILLPPHVAFLLKCVPVAAMVNVFSIREDFDFGGKKCKMAQCCHHWAHKYLRNKCD